jgi:hypothetical protein
MVMVHPRRLGPILLLALALLGAVAGGGAAMTLSVAQLTTLKADMAADGTLSQLPQNSDSADAIAGVYNLLSAPDFWAWRTIVPAAEYRGTGGIVWTEVDALTVGKARIFEWLTGNLTLPINAADSNVRGGITDAFAAGTTTRANLILMGRRKLTRAEKLYATGTGSTASPATMAPGAEGPLSIANILAAWALP